MADLYRDDPLLGPALARGLQTETMAKAAANGTSVVCRANTKVPSICVLPPTYVTAM